jgi:hypothetical protein
MLEDRTKQFMRQLRFSISGGDWRMRYCLIPLTSHIDCNIILIINNSKLYDILFIYIYIYIRLYDNFGFIFRIFITLFYMTKSN